MKNKNIKLLLLSSPLIILGFFINLLSFNSADNGTVEKAYADIAIQTINGSGEGACGGCEGACGCCN